MLVAHGDMLRMPAAPSPQQEPAAAQQRRQQQEQQQPQQQQPQQPQQQREQELREQELRLDRRMGVISLLMWGGTAVRVFPLLSAWENAQSLLAMVVMFLLVVAWPSSRPASYSRWRLPAVSFLRLFLVALPFNFSVRVFDAVAPRVDSGRLVLVSNVFQLCMAIRIALLTFTSLGWRVPFRLHLLLHSANVAMFMAFGLHPYCHGKLLAGEELTLAISMLHKTMNMGGRLFLTNASVDELTDRYQQKVAFVLFCWFIFGWLLPTLLLLPYPDANARHRQQQPQQGQRSLGKRARLAADKLCCWLEAGLQRLLLPPRQATQAASNQQQAAAAPPAAAGEGDGGGVAVWLLSWWVVLFVTWRLACCVAALAA